jgi:hypothetical protein
MRKFVCLLAGLSFALNGCGVAPFKAGQPVQAVGENFFTRVYKQDGTVFNVNQLYAHLEEDPDTKEMAEASDYLRWAAAVPALVGGYMIGYNLPSSSSKKGSQIAIGAGFVALSMIPAYFSDKKLNESVKIYNRKLGVKTSAGFSVLPAFGAVPDGHANGFTPLAGLSGSF